MVANILTIWSEKGLGMLDVELIRDQYVWNPSNLNVY